MVAARRRYCFRHAMDVFSAYGSPIGSIRTIGRRAGRTEPMVVVSRGVLARSRTGPEHAGALAWRATGGLALRKRSDWRLERPLSAPRHAVVVRCGSE